MEATVEETKRELLTSLFQVKVDRIFVHKVCAWMRACLVWQSL
jgi:hypothetical protein